MRLLPATADIDYSAGDVRGRIGQQPHHGVGDLLGRARPSDWNGIANTSRALRIATKRMEFGIDRARANGVDPDPFTGNFDS